jgi:hypothetical protein
VSLIAAGVDPRLKASVPLSASLAWGVATEAPAAWQHDLLTNAGLSIQSPEWAKLLDLVDPQKILSATGVHVMMVNGSSDEFFPLTAHVSTFAAIPGDAKRTSIVANFDHGCYSLTGGESSGTIEERAKIRAEGGQRLWFRHWFGTDDNYSYVPMPPVVQVMPAGALTTVVAAVDAGGPKLDIEEVRVWWSNDDAFLFANMKLKPQAGTLYSEITLFPVQGNSVYFVDVQYKTKALFFPERFSISSLPVVPAGLIPHIRDITSCL